MKMRASWGIETMTKKDYEAIARTVRGSLEAISATELPHTASVREAIKHTAVDLSRIFAADNPRFDRARFLKACGVES